MRARATADHRGQRSDKALKGELPNAPHRLTLLDIGHIVEQRSKHEAAQADTGQPPTAHVLIQDGQNVLDLLVDFDQVPRGDGVGREEQSPSPAEAHEHVVKVVGHFAVHQRLAVA